MSGSFDAREEGKIFKNLELIIFDLDGVLVNLNIDWEGLRETLTEYLSENFGVVPELNPLDATLDRVIKKLDNGAKKEVYKIIENYELADIDNAEPINKTKGLVEKLKKERKRLAVFSVNTRKAVKKSLEMLGLKNYFDFIIAKEDVNKHKPDPEGLERIVKDSGLEKNKILFIGNDWKDKESGRRSNITTVLISDL